MKRIFLLLLPALLALACTKPENGNSGEFYIEVESNVDFGRLAGNENLPVKTNIVGEISCKVSSSGWCEAVYSGGKMTVTVAGNEGSGSRTAIILLEGEKVSRRVTVTQSGWSDSSSEIKSDVRISVAGASASSYQSGEGVERSYDGDQDALYHSSYNETVMPVTLAYNFTNAGIMDYLVYNPRSDGGTNGNFGELELWVATAADPEPVLYGNYDFNGSGSASVIAFNPALQNPTQIKFVVKSGNNGFVSCAEMQFFRKVADSFDYSAIFTDVTCSELKPGIGKTDIDKIDSQFYKELAMEILGGEYNTEFRVQSYRAWQHPNVMATENKTVPYSLFDNPTGIYVRSGDELIVLAGDLHEQSVSLFVQKPDDRINGSSFPLKTGANKFKVPNDGLIYVMYHTGTGTEPSVKLHIVTGKVNGYFDIAKHRPEEWTARLAAATFERFDLVGQYAHMIFETQAYRQYVPDGKALIEKYDNLVWSEQDFMGLFKYDRAFNNRVLFVALSGDFNMYATSYFTAYNVTTQSIIMPLASLTSNCWGPAHEVGHLNQIRPGLRWHGLAEVSNNIHTLYVHTLWGNSSRLTAQGDYTKAFDTIRDKGVPYLVNSRAFFSMVVPFWQLKLYMHDVLGKTDFYKDVYEMVRVNPDPPTDGDCQLEFVKIACDAAQLDLTEFFESWGFLTQIDTDVDDSYSLKRVTVTADMIATCKAYIESKKYPRPTHKIQEITDDNIDDFKL